MKMLSTIVTLLLAVSVFCQNDSTYNLKWKIQADHVLSYNTYMVEMDTTDSQFPSFNIEGLSKMTHDSAAKKHMDTAKQFFSHLNKSTQNNVFVTTLTQNKPGLINIDMRLKPGTDTAVDKKRQFWF